MNIDVVQRSEDLVLVVTGDIDLANSARLDEELTRAQATDAARVIIDLDQVSFIDSTGLKVLLKHVISASKDGRRLWLTRGAPQVQHLFRVTGVSDRLPFLTAS